MQNEVNNRALFRRKSDAARNKLRDMGGIDSGPQGIMASSPELMQASMPQRAMAPQLTGPRPSMQAPQMREQAAPMQAQPLPQVAPSMLPNPQMPQQGIQTLQQGMPQQNRLQQAQGPIPQQGMPQRPQPNQPLRMAEGGDIALELYRQGLGDPSLASQLSAVQQNAQRTPVDVTAAPTVQVRQSETFTPEDVMAALREQAQGDPEAEARAAEVEAALTNPDISEAERADTAAALITGENTRDGRAAALTEMSGQRVSENASLDEINRAISGVALGGAIGGPGSVAERISAAMMTGLQAQRDTAVTREAEAARLRELRAQAAGRGSGSGRAPESWLDSQAGKNAFKLYSDMVSGEYDHEEAIATMNALTPGLGTMLSEAMGAGGPAAAPSQTTVPATDPGILVNPEGVQIRYNGSQWVNVETGEPVE